MKTYYVLIVVSIVMISSCAVSKNTSIPILINQQIKDAGNNDMLLGRCTRDALLKAPFSGWFNPNYNSYVVDSFTCNFIKPLLAGKSITIFMGTWCPDSRREVPRVLKMLDCCGFSPNDLKLVMIGNDASLYKKSPQHEEAGRNIVRVPTIIIEQKGEEIGRIIEFPVISLEKDLLTILKKDKYLPNYSQLKTDAR